MTMEEAIEYLKRADTTVGQKIKTKTAEALELAIRSLEAWDKVKAAITETILYYKDWGLIELKAQHKEEALKEVLDCINRHLKEVTDDGSK